MAIDRNEVGDQEWESALARAEVLRRLPNRPSPGEIADAAVELDVSRSTLFRWLKAFREDQRVAVLVGRKPGRQRRGIDAFEPELKALIDEAIRTFYATPERPTLTRLWKHVCSACRHNRLTPPSIRRLKGYLATFDAEAMTRRREGKARAEAQFLALPGEFSVQHPLQIVQIDHTKVDVTVVDPIERQPIGRVARCIEARPARSGDCRDALRQDDPQVCDDRLPTLAVEQIGHLHEHAMCRRGPGQGGEGAVFAPADDRHGTIDFAIAAERAEVSDAAPVRVDRATTQLGRSGPFGVGEARLRTTQAGQAETCAQQIVAIAVGGHAQRAESIVSHRVLLRSDGNTRAGDDGRNSEQEDRSNHESVHAATLRTFRSAAQAKTAHQ